MELKVKNTRFINITVVKEPIRGNLFVAEDEKQIPFSIKRFYFINGVSPKTPARGGHAHHIKKEQVIFCLNGSFELSVDDGKTKEAIIMNDPSRGVYIGLNVWVEMKQFSENCVILVVTNTHYDAADYIKTYDEFLALIKKS